MNTPHSGKPAKYYIKDRLVSYVIFAVLFLCSMLLLSNLYMVSYSNRKISETNARTMQFCVNQIERYLSDIDDMLCGLAATSTDYQILSSGAKPLQAHVSAHNLVTQFREYQRIYSSCDAMMIYSSTSSVWRDSFAGNINYTDKTKIRHWMKQSVEENAISYRDGWVTRSIDGTNYLMRFYGSNSTYLITLFSFDSLKSMGLTDGDDAELAFCYNDGTPLDDSHPEINFAKVVAQDSYLITGSPRCMVLHQPLANTDITLVLLVSQSGFFNGLPTILVFLLILSFFSICLIPASLHQMHQCVIRPLDSLAATIKTIRAGNLEAKAPDSDVAEFQEISDIFNEMMQQIRDLKQEAYEQGLSTQQAQMQYLQLQIRPHFYLNCLKELYSIAQQQNTEKLLHFILSISGHLRYIFRDQSSTVTLEQELSHIRNYIDIQQLTSAYPLECRILVPDELLSFQILPLTLSTFVENSCKHRADGMQKTVITVSARLLDDGDDAYVFLSVSDNGPGFSDEVLGKINMEDDDPIYSTEHVGIRNIRHRFRLAYGKKAVLAFYNLPQGCTSEIFIPYHHENVIKPK